MYRYNNDKIRLWAEEQETTAWKIAKKMQMVNPKAPMGWVAGGDLRVSNLLNFINTYKLNLLDFFFEDDTLMSETHQTNEQTIEELRRQHTREMEELKIQHLREIGEIERKHLREIADLKKSLGLE